MSQLIEKLPLKASSPQGWLDAVLADFDRFLLDHAACERKASALAMSFIVKFSDRLALIEPMVALAREELAHFHEVYRIMAKRRLSLGADEKDPYVTAFLKHVRHGRDQHFLDRLLVAAIIEARGCERFYRVGEALESSDRELAEYYQKLGREEAGHYKIFVNIAKNYYSDLEVRERMNELLDIEAEVMLSVPFRAAVH